MIRYIIATIVMAALLSACGSDPVAAPVESVETGDVALAAPSVAMSPLEQELGFASDPERRRFQLLSMQRQADSTMVQCMKQAGFFYAVRPAEEVLRSGSFVGDGSRDWTLANGLGITSSFREALAADAARQAADAETTNLDYVASLTPEQQTAYDLALVGDLVADLDAEVLPAPGCWAVSYLDIVTLLRTIDTFDADLASLNSRLDADPRVQGFTREWSACMGAAGYRYASEQALVDDVYARLLDIELVDDEGVTRVVSPQALDALAQFEIEAAVAAFDCRLGFAAEITLLRNDYEREFLDDNRFRIAALREPS